MDFVELTALIESCSLATIGLQVIGNGHPINLSNHFLVITNSRCFIQMIYVLFMKYEHLWTEQRTTTAGKKN